SRLAVTNGSAGIVVAASGEVGAADRPATDEFDGFRCRRSTPTLVAHLNPAVVLAGGLNQQFAFPRVMTARFLDVHVFAGSAAKDRGWRVPVVAGRNHQNVDRAVIQ